MSLYEVLLDVLEMDSFTAKVVERRAGLEVMESPGCRVAEFEVEGSWFGSRLRRTRHFKWMLYVALWDSGGNWIDHHENLLRWSRRDGWVLLQPPERVLDFAERFARERLEPRRQ